MKDHSSISSVPLSAWRRVVWPIYKEETKKFLPLAFMMFFMLFNYTILRTTKDTLVITASGAEIIPFLKGVVVLPFSILIVAIYAKLSNLLSPQKVFYSVLSTFLGVFALYILVIFPNKETLEMSPERLQVLKSTYPHFQHFFSVVGHWSSSLFYLFAELWGPTILSLMFWQFANEITRTREASRFYGMFGFIGQLAPMAAGYLGTRLCDMNLSLEDSAQGWSHYLHTIVGALLCSGMAILGLYYWMNQYVLKDPKYYDRATSVSVEKVQKPKMSLRESFSHIVQSKYLGYMAIMLIGYGLTMNLTGILWKKQLQLQYPNPLQYAYVMSQFSFLVGFSTVVLIFFLKGIVGRFGWYRAAIITPLILVVTVIPFFTFIFYENQVNSWLSWAGLSPLMLAVFIGGAQQILCRSSKYSIFEPTKEMAYIPLDQELKIKGKAAVDVSVYSFSKACGGYISGGLLILTAASDLMVVAPYLAGIVVVVIVFWFVAIRRLSRLYYRLVNKRDFER